MSSELEDQLHGQILAVGLPAPTVQYRIRETGRKHAWDLAWPDRRVVVDVQGGGWLRGRHHRPQGYRADCEKANLAVLAGYRVYRVDDSMVKDGTALATIDAALKGETA